MELQACYNRINLPPEIIQTMNHIGTQINLSEFEEYLEQMLDANEAEQGFLRLKEALGDDTDNQKMLYCQLECARRAHDNYSRKHIPENIYTDTMKCFSRFLAECEKKNGKMFFDRAWWTYRQISMRLFRIGALEYEIVQREGENLVELHIPSDADLSPEAVDESLKNARDFFSIYQNGHPYRTYACDSWLLSPALKPLLDENSRILQFQQRFQIMQEHRDDQDFIQWLFQVPLETPYERLPENTSLQKKAKKLLLSGGNIGSAYGIMDAGR